MLITVLRQTMIAGESVSAGSTLDLDADTASLLIGIGKAVTAAPPAVTDAAEAIEAVEPPKPTRSARKSTSPAP
jgi:hypothetical protein